jgi:UDP-glucose 4-epimerase
MRVLITGGFGYIGGRLGQYLHQAGQQIILGSRNPDSLPNWLSNVEVANTDWNDVSSLEQACHGVDIVIQAAGLNAQECAADPVAALAINGLATARLIASATRAGVKRFIYLSTAHIYASPLMGIISEDTCPNNLHPYATSHVAGESAVLGANQRKEIEGLVLRLSNVFGAPAHKDVNCWMLLANDLCKQAVQTRQLVLRSSGLQKRDFIAMADVCRAIEHLSVCARDVFSDNVINIGSGVSQSVIQMAYFIQQRCFVLFGYEPTLEFPSFGGCENTEMFEYNTDRLTELGLGLGMVNELEIDRLLTFCKTLFDKIDSVNV